MQDELNDLHRHVLATFGQPVTLVFTDDASLDTTGIISKELIPTGHHDGVLQEITAISLDRNTVLKRGMRVLTGEQQWTVDRKLKDDGQLAYWSLYENRS